MPHLHIRPARPEDLPAIEAMFAHSKRVMRANGNLHQWAGSYPSPPLLLQDIQQKAGRIIEHLSPTGSPEALGYFAFFIGTEPTYHHIEGAWLDDTAPYGTIHRLAGNRTGCHLAQACLAYCERQAPTLRIDTHADNTIMQHIAAQWNFSYCGIITLPDGTLRRAYQRLLPSHIVHSLQRHVQQHILPLYDAFDAAHRRPHARSVIRRSVALARKYGQNINMMYAAAAYHDVGLCQGRDTHHLVSAHIIRSDATLARWFSPAQIETIAQAAEDHRASGGKRPRSMIGVLLAEADRDLRATVVVERTVQYSLAHYPHLDEEGHWQRTLQHLQEKYSTAGYLQLLLPDSPNAAPLRHLQALIAHPERLRPLFAAAYDQATRGTTP